MGSRTTLAGMKVFENEITEAIKAGMKANNISADDLAIEAMIPRPTLYRRISNPSSFRMDEFYRVSTVLGIKMPLEVM